MTQRVPHHRGGSLASEATSPSSAVIERARRLTHSVPMRSTTASLLPFSRRAGSAQLRPSLRWMSLVAEVRPGEAGMALTLALARFLLLPAYYLLKGAREPLILLGGGAEVKAYASAGQALLLIGVLKAYDAIASRLGRMALLAVVLTFFAANLVVFSLALRAGLAVGIPFYLWVG